MAAEWFYLKNEKQVGPVTSSQLKQLADSGRLQPADLVWKQGMANRVAASKIKGLFTVASAVTPSVVVVEPMHGSTANSPVGDAMTTNRKWVYINHGR